MRFITLTSFALAGGMPCVTGFLSANRGERILCGTPVSLSSTNADNFVEDESESSTPSEEPPAPEKPKPRGPVMSKAIPILECPPVLVNSDLAGNFGFDPLQFSKNEQDLLRNREAEIKHGRLAMLVREHLVFAKKSPSSNCFLRLPFFSRDISFFPFQISFLFQAAIGWPMSELMDKAIAETFNAPAMLDEYGRAPSILNDGIQRVSPVWWGFCLGLCAAIDMYGVSKARRGGPDYFPGNLGFDPWGLYPADKEGQLNMQLAEIKHGRTAMIGVMGYVFEEFTTKESVVEDTPILFQPITETVEEALQEAIIVEETIASEASEVLQEAGMVGEAIQSAF